MYITDTAPLGKFNVGIDERYGRYGGDLIAGSPCAVNSEIQLTRSTTAVNKHRRRLGASESVNLTVSFSKSENYSNNSIGGEGTQTQRE